MNLNKLNMYTRQTGNNLHRLNGRFGHVSECRHGPFMTDSDVESSFEGRLVKARQYSSGVSRFHLCSTKPSIS